MTRRFVGFGTSGGAGSGTVTNTGGALTANAVVLGAGGNDSKVSTGITTNGASELDLGVAGTSGVLGLNGSTSGKATITAPAIAGTTSNPVVSTNALQLPSLGQGVAGLNFAGSSGFFTSDTTNHWLLWGSSAVDWVGLKNNASGIALQTNGAIAWVPGNNIATGVVDTGISRQGVGLLGFGNGTGADETGLIRAANGVRVTADITLTVNTAITIFSFALPAVAKAWGWQAVIPWVCSAATGTPTLSIGVNYTQTPTGTTGAQANILTTNTGTSTQAYVALSATGATNILTTGTLTPGATVFQSTCSGTLLASATAGTFTITMTLTSTTTTALAKAGATCWFY